MNSQRGLDHWTVLSCSPKVQSRSHPRAKYQLRVKQGLRLGVPRASGRTDTTEGVVLWRALLWPDFLAGSQSTGHS